MRKFLILATLVLSAPALAKTLSEELKEMSDKASAQTPEEAKKTMARATDDLRKSDILKRAAKVGDKAPDFELPNAQGTTVKFSDARAKGPVVVTFYRGGWCPYCNLQLRALQKSLPDMKKRGASLVAISPEKGSRGHPHRGDLRPDLAPSPEKL